MSRTLTKKLASVKPGTLFAGVDLAKDRNVVAMIDQHARQLDRFSSGRVGGHGADQLLLETPGH